MSEVEQLRAEMRECAVKSARSVLAGATYNNCGPQLDAIEILLEVGAIDEDLMQHLIRLSDQPSPDRERMRAARLLLALSAKETP